MNSYNIPVIDRIRHRNSIIYDTPLMMASIYGHPEIAKLLLSQPGIGLNSQDI